MTEADRAAARRRLTEDPDVEVLRRSDAEEGLDGEELAEPSEAPRKRAAKKAVKAAAGHDITPDEQTRSLDTSGEDMDETDGPDVLDLIIRTAIEEKLTQEDLDFLYDAMRHGQAARAAGADITPGHDELHHYWTLGEGKAKWVGSPTPWRTLVAHLTKYVGPLKAKVFASRWYIEVFGYSAGSDKARVAHGKPPRGDRVGPG